MNVGVMQRRNNMHLFRRIKKECMRNSCDECHLFRDSSCLLQRPPSEWNKGEIKRAFRKEK